MKDYQLFMLVTAIYSSDAMGGSFVIGTLFFLLALREIYIDYTKGDIQ